MTLNTKKTDMKTETIIESEYTPPFNMKAPSTWLATWFGAGFMRPAPGTWGALMAIPYGILIHQALGAIALTIAIILLYPIGVWSAQKFGEATGHHDDKMIVIDEVIGQWIALLPALIIGGLNPLYILLSFATFRLFDIKKPWLVGYFDHNMKNAHGVMLDDVTAGVFAGLFTFGLILGELNFA